MLYVIYCTKDDINDMTTTSLTSALMRAGDLVDMYEYGLPENAFSVYLYDMTEEEYNDAFVNDSDATAIYTLKQFIAEYGVPELSPMEKENLQHLSTEEQLEVIKWIPDHIIIDEIYRRFDEYRTYADAVREAGDKLRIFV